MKILISWSGPRSKAIATALHGWLPQVIQEIEPWMSAHDISQGSLWRSKLFAELANVKFAVVCLTPENLGAPWLHFEAGAVAKELLKDEKGAVCTYLLNLKNTDVEGPLADIQHTTADLESTRKLLADINKMADKPVPALVLTKAFDLFWPDLESAINEFSSKSFDEAGKPPGRTDREMLEEILDRVRQLGQPSQAGALANVLAGMKDAVQNRQLAPHQLFELLKAFDSPVSGNTLDVSNEIARREYRGWHNTAG